MNDNLVRMSHLIIESSDIRNISGIMLFLFFLIFILISVTYLAHEVCIGEHDQEEAQIFLEIPLENQGYRELGQDHYI